MILWSYYIVFVRERIEHFFRIDIYIQAEYKCLSCKTANMGLSFLSEGKFLKPLLLLIPRLAILRKICIQNNPCKVLYLWELTCTQRRPVCEDLVFWYEPFRYMYSCTSIQWHIQKLQFTLRNIIHFIILREKMYISLCYNNKITIVNYSNIKQKFCTWTACYNECYKDIKGIFAGIRLSKP